MQLSIIGQSCSHKKKLKNRNIISFLRQNFRNIKQERKIAIKIEVINNEIHTITIFHYNRIESQSTATVFSTRANKQPETDHSNNILNEQTNCLRRNHIQVKISTELMVARLASTRTEDITQNVRSLCVNKRKRQNIG